MQLILIIISNNNSVSVIGQEPNECYLLATLAVLC